MVTTLQYIAMLIDEHQRGATLPPEHYILVSHVFTPAFDIVYNSIKKEAYNQVKPLLRKALVPTGRCWRCDHTKISATRKPKRCAPNRQHLS